jgi:hypothetical protein
LLGFQYLHEPSRYTLTVRRGQRLCCTYETTVLPVPPLRNLLLRGYGNAQTDQPPHQKRKRSGHDVERPERIIPPATLNIQIARAYLTASNPAMSIRSWQAILKTAKVSEVHYLRRLHNLALPVVTTPHAPTWRVIHSAIWTGSEIIISGGFGEAGCVSDTWSCAPPKLLYLYLK